MILKGEQDENGWLINNDPCPNCGFVSGRKTSDGAHDLDFSG